MILLQVFVYKFLIADDDYSVYFYASPLFSGFLLSPPLFIILAAF